MAAAERVWTTKVLDFDINEHADLVKTNLRYRSYGTKFEYADDLSPSENLLIFYRLGHDDGKKWGHRPVSDKFIKKVHRRYVNILKKIPSNPDLYVDYGCGDGRTTQGIAAVLRPKKTMCVDVQDYRQAKYGEFVGNPDVDSFNDAFVVSSIGVTSLFQSLHHVAFGGDVDPVERISRVIGDITSRTAPGGNLIVREHDVNEKRIIPVLIEHLVYEVMEIQKDLSDAEFYKWLGEYAEKHDGWYMSKKDLRRIIKSHGWKSVYSENVPNSTFIYNELWVKQ